MKASRQFLSLFPLLALLPLLLAPVSSQAETPEYQLTIQNHLFTPDVIRIPAQTKVRLRIINLDPTAEEFESYPLNREKIIAGNSQTVLFIGPLPSGEYPFFGEFNPNTALGKIIVE